MKKWISLLLALALLLPLVSPGQAYATGFFRDAFEDVSELEVDESAGNDRVQGDTQVKIGTDIYLYVDPDTASYVTFLVTDEQGNPIEDAPIWLSYKGETEFFGTTDENGEISAYLFRDVAYSYTVMKEGYETVIGSFVATEALTTVRVVMRKLHQVQVVIQDNGKPVPGATVIIDGKEYITDEEGKITLEIPNGVYPGTVIAPDGREIPFQFEIRNEGKTVIVDIGKDDTLMTGGAQQDSFLVYNKHYNPEDYVLTYFAFQESEKQPSTILVQAQPERKQSDSAADVDILAADGKPLYTQRSMMPSGALLKYWQDQGYRDLVFSNEDMGLKIALSDFHSAQMTKVYNLMRHLLDEEKVPLEQILAASVDAKGSLYPYGLHALYKEDLGDRLTGIDLDALAAVEFTFDHEKEGKPGDHTLLEDVMFTGSTFELRITPIQGEDLREMIRDGIPVVDAVPKSELVLANTDYFNDELRKWLSDGHLSDNEAHELYSYVIDGKLTKEELKQLKEDYRKGTLTDNALDLLVQAALEENLYRVSVWVIYRDLWIEVTHLMQSMELIRSVDEQYEALCEQYTNEKKQNASELAEKNLAKNHTFLIADNQSDCYETPGYRFGDGLTTLTGTLLLLEDESREFENLTVDVRLESRTVGSESVPGYTAKAVAGKTKLTRQHLLTCSWNSGALVALTAPEESK